MAPKVDSYAYLPYAQSYGYQVPLETVVPFGDSTGLDPITQGLDPVTQGVAQDISVVAAAPAIAPVAAAAPVVAPVVASAPVVAPVAPAVAVAPAVSGSQYHAQDDAGQYSFGYNDPNSIKQEIKTLDGVVRGAYKYVDTDGILQTVEYIADDAGFRVAATNLPVASGAPVVDTPEVAAAKAAHYAAIEEDRSAQVGIVAPAPVVASAPIAQPTPVVQATPIVQAAPVTYAQAVAPVVQAPIATPVVQAAPVAYVQTAPVAAAPAPEGSQYHAQDDYGQYSFGYADGNSVKQEIKTADGVVRGAYSYVDSDGIVQTVNYISDALGFRVGATNLPVHHVDQPAAPVAAAAPVPAAAPVTVAAAPVAAAAQVAQAAPVPVTYSQSVMTPAVNYAYLPYATNYAYETPAAPVAVASAPVAVQAAPAPVVASSPVVAAAPAATGAPYDVANTQYHAQDDFGQFNYGYSNPLSTKQELKTADGVTRGSYSYVDANGIVQTVNYLSDAMGFKVAATNLPVGPAPDPVVVDTVEPEIVEAYSAPAEEKVLTPSVQYAYLPYAQNYEYYGAAVPKVVAPTVQAAPVTYAQSAPVVQVAQAAPAVVPFGDSTGLDPITQGLDPVTQGVVQAAPVVTYAQTAPVVQAAPVAEPLEVSGAAPVAVPAAAPVAVPAAAPVAVPAAAPVAVPVPQAAPVVVPAAAPVVAAAPEGSQYHAQDDFGQYSFGYSDGNSVKQEVKTADGVIRGAYSYVDSDGIVQTVNYIADALGFRVGATNLPVHHVDSQPAAPVAVAAAPVAVEAAPVAVEATPAVAATPVAQAYHPYASSYTYAAPAPVVAAAPAVSVPVQAPQVAVAAVAPAAVPVAATATDAANSQFHAQDDIGQFNYGYSNPLSTKQELKTADGVTRGSYSYVDANGIVQTVNYLSDAMGFRVAATNLPVHHVEDVPAAPEAPVMAPSVNYAYLPYATNYGYNLASPAA